MGIRDRRGAADGYDKDEAIAILQAMYRTVDDSAPEPAEVVPLKVAT